MISSLLAAAAALTIQASAEPKICDQTHLWTTAEQDEAIRRCEAERSPEERLGREQARQPGRVGGMSNSPEHRRIRVLAMNKRCDEALPQARATGDIPMIRWVEQMCGQRPAATAPRPQPRSAPVEDFSCGMVQLWTSAQEAAAIDRCKAEKAASSQGNGGR